MKLLIFGATGSVGRQVVKQGLDQGHLITAFARHPEKLGIQHPNLQLFQGNVLDLGAVEQAMQGQDAVVCTLGAGKKLTGTVRSEGTRQIIQAMEEIGVRRLICLSTLGTGDSWGNLNFYWKYVMFGFMLRLYKQGFTGTDNALTLEISRADVADFSLKQLTSDAYLGKSPSLSY